MSETFHGSPSPKTGIRIGELPCNFEKGISQVYGEGTILEEVWFCNLIKDTCDYNSITEDCSFNQFFPDKKYSISIKTPEPPPEHGVRFRKFQKLITHHIFAASSREII